MDYAVLFDSLNFFLRFWIIALIYRSLVFIFPEPIRAPIEHIGLKMRTLIQKSVLRVLGVTIYEESDYFLEHSKVDSFGHLLLVFIVAPIVTSFIIAPSLLAYSFSLWEEYPLVSLVLTLIGFSILCFAIPTVHDLSKISNASGKSILNWMIKASLWITFIEILDQAFVINEVISWSLLAIGVFFPGRSMNLELDHDFSDFMTSVVEVK